MKEIKITFPEFVTDFANNHGNVEKETSLRLHKRFKNGLSKQNLLDLSKDSFENLSFVFVFDENNKKYECKNLTRGETDYLLKSSARQVRCSEYATSALTSAVESGKRFDGRFSVLKMIGFIQDLLTISSTHKPIGCSYDIEQTPPSLSEFPDDLEDQFKLCSSFMERYPNNELTKRTKEFYIADVKIYAEKVLKDSSSFLSNHE